MRKMAIAALLLAVIIFLTMYESGKIEDICLYNMAQMEKLDDDIERRDFESAQKELLKIKEKWEKDEKFLDAVTTHEDTDTVNVLFTEIGANIRHEDFESAQTVADKLKLQFEHIRKRSEIKISNIL